MAFGGQQQPDGWDRFLEENRVVLGAVAIAVLLCGAYLLNNYKQKKAIQLARATSVRSCIQKMIEPRKQFGLSLTDRLNVLEKHAYLEGYLRASYADELGGEAYVSLIQTFDRCPDFRPSHYRIEGKGKKVTEPNKKKGAKKKGKKRGIDEAQWAEIEKILKGITKGCGLSPIQRSLIDIVLLPELKKARKKGKDGFVTSCETCVAQEQAAECAACGAGMAKAAPGFLAQVG